MIFIAETKGQCPSGDLIFYRQSQINEFADNYPNCIEFTNSLVINGDHWMNTEGILDIETLEPLEQLQSVKELFVDYTLVESLDGLQNLTGGLGALYIRENQNLDDISALSGITTIENQNSNFSYLTISQNPLLASLNGLENISNFYGGANPLILNNNSLTDISSLNSFQINDDKRIRFVGNDNLSQCSIDWFCANPSFFSFENNAEGCSNNTEVLNSCSSQDCPQEDVIFSNQAEINAFLQEYPDCTILSNLKIGDGNQNDITDLTPLSNIETVNGYLQVWRTQLETLYGLHNLSIVNDAIMIDENSLLNDISSLNSIAPNSIALNGVFEETYDYEDVTIYGNPNLSMCSIDNFCEAYEMDGVEFYISNNSYGCGSNYHFEVTCSTDCPPGVVGLFSQEEVEEFALLYPDCTELNGGLIIGTDFDSTEMSNIDDLSPLSNINSINGELYIRYTNMEEINDLNLTDINYSPYANGLKIENNPNLINVDFLNDIDIFNGNFSIVNNSNLNSISGLNLSEQSSIGYIMIANNNSLVSISGFNNVYQASSLNISNNEQLEQISAFEDLEELYSGGFNIENIPNILTLTSFQNLEAINGYFNLKNCHALTSLDGMQNLTSINGWLRITENEGLNSLEGIENLLINSSPQGRMDNFSIESLEITDNPNLSNCAVFSVCEITENESIEIIIENNATGCNTVEEVAEACAAMDVTEMENQKVALSIYPNPAKDEVHIQIAETIQNVTIYTTTGQMVKAQKQAETLQVSDLSAGIYFMQIETDKGTYIEKLIIK